MQNKEINLFFSVDDNYCKFLSVTLDSIIKNSNKENTYNVYVLNSGLSDKHKMLLNSQADAYKNFNIFYEDMNEKLQKFKGLLFTRDFYNQTIYYRLFIPSLFPNIDKALYLDSDIILLDDVAKLYNTELGDTMLGVIIDEAVQNTQIFKDYVEQALDVKNTSYFNSGVMVMNLKKLREVNFEDQFFNLSKQYSFKVAPDQDVLNILCEDKTTIIDNSWNKMPIKDSYYQNEYPHLVHFNMMFKPWQFDDIQYCHLFWEIADKNIFKDEIYKTKAAFTNELREKAITVGQRLFSIAQEELDNPNNYKRQFIDKK